MKAIFDLDARRVLQQCKSEHRIHARLSHRAIRFATGVGEKYENAVFETEGGISIGRWFQSTARMRYDCLAWQPDLPDAREEAM
jgi:hypothetical protein